MNDFVLHGAAMQWMWVCNDRDSSRLRSRLAVNDFKFSGGAGNKQFLNLSRHSVNLFAVGRVSSQSYPQPFNDISIDQMLIDDFIDIFLVEIGIPRFLIALLLAGLLLWQILQ